MKEPNSLRTKPKELFHNHLVLFGSLLITIRITIGLSILPVLLLSGSFNINTIITKQSSLYNTIPLLPVCFIFFISILAETNRAPFDMPEAEAEIVAGYNLEYSSITFAIFFLGEYSNMLVMSSLLVVLFLGGWIPLLLFGPLISFILKLLCVTFLFILVRANFPRVRYDQLIIFN
jgi:NADH-quinone oxidoreductase subunit H